MIIFKVILFMIIMFYPILVKNYHTLCFALLLMLIPYLSLAQIQTTFPHESHRCTHLCALSRIKNTSIGIYDQDIRVHNYDVKFYGLNLEVHPSTTFIDGSVRILAEVTADEMQQMVLELVDELTVQNVELAGESLSFSHQNNVVEIDLDGTHVSGSLLDIVVYYSGEPIADGFFAGISSNNNNLGDPVLWTLSEPHNARQWFPCKQVLDDKADSVHVSITTPQEFMAASNGLLIDVTELPGGLVTYHWKSFYPIAYYLISIAVSNYQEYNFYAPVAQEQDSVFIQNFIYNHPDVLESLRENLERTRDFMEVFSEKWGVYPFLSEKYGHAQAPMGGAMEHQTMSTMGSFGFDITAHELAHHWFGNQVTCATWSDIWINEGFASYGEFMAREFILGRDLADNWMENAHNNIKSQPGGSIYVPPLDLSDVWRIFSGRLSYRKGAAMLHLLRFELNDDDLFFHIMEDFQQTFSHDVASGDDFRITVELNTGENWQWFFNQWYYGEGYPIYEITWWQDDENLYIKSSQSASVDYPVFFEGTLEFKIITEGEEQFIRMFQDEPVQLFEIPLNDKIDHLIFDPRRYMLKDFVLIDSAGVNDELSQADLTLGPNPVTDILNVYFEGRWDNAHFFISDLTGRKLLDGQFFNRKHTLNLSGLDTGLYLLKVVSIRGEQKSIKFFKE
ncbi:MAG: M1 family aminopeptidase [Bacteroidales bacterium]